MAGRFGRSFPGTRRSQRVAQVTAPVDLTVTPGAAATT
jgi:hypothetical protein